MRDVAVDRQHDRRPIERIDQLRRDDADDAAVPAFAGDDQDAPGADLGIGLDDLLRLGEDVLILLAAARVLGLELVGKRLGFVGHRFVGREQQPRGDVRRAHAAGGVDARRDHEADVIAVDRLSGQAGGFEQRAQADLVRPLGQHLQPELRDDAVLANERDHVGERADRGDLYERRQPGRLSGAGTERLHKLQRDPDAGQVLVGISAVVPFRIHHRAGIRQFIVGFVMVGDDQIDAKLTRAACRFGRADAAVDRDDQLDAFGMQSIDGARLKAVAVGQPFGNEVADVGAKQLEGAAQDHRRGDAVDVVVAMHGNALAA